MGVRFVFGPSGAGKSIFVQDHLIKESIAHREKNYVMIVPDQYTMQTQKEMATRHPNGGILNIDVLSFGRLKHRIFAEVGKEDLMPLDDTGKCLILRKVVSEQKENLTVLKKGMSNPGYIEEIKSIISEFMQYGISPDDLDDFIKHSDRQKSLAYKLTDLKLIYREFQTACKDKYMTTEESLHMLCRRIPLARSMAGSVIVFDGFTGFTPIQIDVIITLSQYAEEVLITLPFDERYEPYRMDGEEFFLHLTQKTVKSIQTRLQQENIPLLPDIVLSGEKNYRFAGNPELLHLERNLFRKEAVPYSENVHNIEIVKAGTVEQECHLACEWMFKQIEQNKYRYRDIAIITGDMNTYRDPLKQFFERYEIPYFMDSTVDMLKNPFIQFLRSSLSVLNNNFSFRDCMAMLRCGYADFTNEEIDLLENYIRAKAIKGRRKWNKDFTTPTRELKNKLWQLDEINELRQRFMKQFELFGENPGSGVKPATKWAEIFFYFTKNLDLQNKLKKQEEKYSQAGDVAREKEYSQLFRYVIELLDQIAGLLGEEEISLKTFAEILEAGYGEIRVGILPQNIDSLIVGDMERTRLKEIKALLFLGINDGNIPKAGKKGGIISDMERNIMLETGKELAPSPAEQIFVQKLYLYLNVTKPVKQLYLSYASISEGGERRVPSYFIKTMKDLFPKMKVQSLETRIPILSVKDCKEKFCILLSKYATGIQLNEKETVLLRQYYGDLIAREDCREWVYDMVDHAFYEYIPSELELSLARELYGRILNCSVSSLEKFAGCQYAHFLAYGLRLSEREEAVALSRDYGNLNHSILENVGKNLLQDGKYMNDLTEDEIDRQIEVVLNQLREENESGLFEEGVRGQYFEKQMKRLMKRTFTTISKQLSHGQFRPEMFEVEFGQKYKLDQENDKEIRLIGKIDRIDLCHEIGQIYVKIVDYKSSGKEFKTELFESGIQLQLAVYMKQAIEAIKRKYPKMEISPAAMLYYHVFDPFIELSELKSLDELENKRMEKMNHKGVVTEEREIVEKMDANLSGKSSVLPIKLNKNGEVSSSSAVSPEYFNAMLDYAQNIVMNLAEDVYLGKIAINPAEDTNYDACEYCSYKEACPYDDKIKGFHKRKLVPMEERKEDK